MAKLLNGINGPIRGKVGTVVGSSWKGIDYIKAKYKPRTKNITNKEKGNRSKFSMAQYWLKPLKDFVRQGFKGYTPTVEGFVAAKSYLMKNAMEGSGAESVINPSLVKVSHGDLPVSENISVSRIADDQFQFTWDTKIPAGASEKDQVMLLAYDIKSEFATWSLTGQFRSTGSDILRVQYIKGSTYLVYAAFVAADRSRQSNSIYLGEITL